MVKSSTTLVACLALALVAAIEAGPTESLHSQWTQFKAQHGKQYTDAAEEAKRLEVFAANKLKVDQFNLEQSEQAGYRLEVNHLSDRTDEEFGRMLGSSIPSEHLSRRSNATMSESLRRILESDDPVPDSVDWRQSGRVSSVKDQGNCASSWAFSAAGVLEGQESTINISQTISLSSQDVMDCGRFGYAPCKFGNMMTALYDISVVGGVESEADYPYQGIQSDVCEFTLSKSVIVNKDVGYVPVADEESMKKSVAKYGPVAAAINVGPKSNLRHYKSGVYTDNFCEKNILALNTFFLVVGYGTDPKEGDYWIVKNSWSANWGDGGYFKMARNRKNMCGIATLGIMAIL